MFFITHTWFYISHFVQMVEMQGKQVVSLLHTYSTLALNDSWQTYITMWVSRVAAWNKGCCGWNGNSTIAQDCIWADQWLSNNTSAMSVQSTVPEKGRLNVPFHIFGYSINQIFGQLDLRRLASLSDLVALYWASLLALLSL